MGHNWNRCTTLDMPFLSKIVAQEVFAGYAIRKGQTVSAWEESESLAIQSTDSFKKDCVFLANGI